MSLIELRNGSVVATINKLNQQLVSLTRNGREYMWGGGKPDSIKSKEEKRKDNWQYSEIIMFPVPGPSSDDIVKIDGTNYFMPQHGLSRYLSRKIVDETTDTTIQMEQTYNGNKISTPKGVIDIPFHFTLGIEYEVNEYGLRANFSVTNRGNTLSYALGWHPAFLLDAEDSYIVSHRKGKAFSFDQIRNASVSKTLQLENENEISFVGKDRFVRMKSDMSHMAVWSPNSHMFCIEPLTAPFNRIYRGDLSRKPGYIHLNRKMMKRYHHATIEIV